MDFQYPIRWTLMQVWCWSTSNIQNFFHLLCNKNSQRSISSAIAVVLLVFFSVSRHFLQSSLSTIWPWGLFVYEDRAKRFRALEMTTLKRRRKIICLKLWTILRFTDSIKLWCQSAVSLRGWAVFVPSTCAHDPFVNFRIVWTAFVITAIVFCCTTTQILFEKYQNGTVMMKYEDILGSDEMVCRSEILFSKFELFPDSISRDNVQQRVGVLLQMARIGFPLGFLSNNCFRKYRS